MMSVEETEANPLSTKPNMFCSVCLEILKYDTIDGAPDRNSTDPKNCFLCEGLLINLKHQILSDKEFMELYASYNEYSIIIEVANSIKNRIESRSNKKLVNPVPNFKKELKEHVIKSLGLKFSNTSNLVLKVLIKGDVIERNIQILPLYIGGRYLKLQDNISQTPLIIKNKKVCEFSVSELVVEHLKEYYNFDDSVFSASGREDIDVKMLGNGRPFYIKLIKPIVRNREDPIKDLKTDKIEALNMKVVSVDKLALLKEGEELKNKSYSAIIYSFDKIDDDLVHRLNTLKTPIEVIQSTPLRVLHRRSLMERKRNIHKFNIEKINENYLKLDIVTDAGLYVKEFVHGDLDRTFPNMKEMLSSSMVDMVELNVTGIDLEWP